LDRTSITALAALLLACAAPRTSGSAGALAARLSTARAADALPSLSAAVARGGDPVLAEAQGAADAENALSATPASVYRVGSLSKTLTATAALALAAGGRLDLDAPVQRYCPSFPERHAGVTTRRLLAHLGGIRDYDRKRFAEEFFSTRRYTTAAESVALFAEDPLVAIPGTRFLYSSWGYVLVGCALEGAAGEPYAEVVRRLVLEPAGMTATVLDVPEALVFHRVRGYDREAGGALSNSAPVDLSNRWPAGGWLSTPTDLVRFVRALLEGRILPAASLEAMWTEQRTDDGKPTGYALGWRVGAGGNEVFHGGSSVGGSAYLYVDRVRGVIVALATNASRWDEPRHALARALAAPPP
jgi:CubicO group peptidase (beta-lactamase class C family)